MNDDRPRCVSCSHWIRPDDAPRIVCRPCESAAKGNLAALAGAQGLFAQLVWAGSDILLPGQRSQGGGGGSRVDAPMPVRLGPMNLLGAGGVVHTLQRWVATWYQELGFRQPVWRGNLHFVMMVDPQGHKVGRPGQLDNAVTILINNLPWATEHRDDFGRFARDLNGFVEQIKSALDPTIEPPTRVQIGRCPTPTEAGTKCGELLDANPWANAIRCRRCGTSWIRADWPKLGNEMNPA